MTGKRNNTFLDDYILAELNECIKILDLVEEKNIHQSVHTLRKSMKRMRGWLRAARPAGNAKSYNRELSGIGKEISNLRDSTSALESLDRIRNTYGPWMNQQLLTTMENELMEYRSKITEAMRPVFMRVRARLSALLHNYESFGISGYSDLLHGIQQTYTDAREAFRETSEKKDAESFHEWRKRTKDLQNQMLFFPDDIPYFNKVHLSFDELAGLLGNDQDLYLLEAAIPDSSLPEEAKALLSAIMSYEHHRLQNEAVRLGRAIFDKTPKIFVRQITATMN